MRGASGSFRSSRFVHKAAPFRTYLGEPPPSSPYPPHLGTGKGVMLFGALLLLFSTVAIGLADFLWRRGLIDPIVVVVVHLG